MGCALQLSVSQNKKDKVITSTLSPKLVVSSAFLVFLAAFQVFLFGNHYYLGHLARKRNLLNFSSLPPFFRMARRESRFFLLANRNIATALNGQSLLA